MLPELSFLRRRMVWGKLWLDYVSIIINFPRNAIPGEIPRETIIELGYIDGPFAMIWGFIALIFYKRYKINKAYHDEIKAGLIKKI